MPTAYLTRACLIVVLLFSQAIYAGHAMAHDGGNQLDCELCLHTSTGTDALPRVEIPATFSVPCGPTLFARYNTVPVVFAFPKSHPGRAPPFFSI